MYVCMYVYMYFHMDLHTVCMYGRMDGLLYVAFVCTYTNSLFFDKISGFFFVLLLLLLIIVCIYTVYVCICVRWCVCLSTIPIQSPFYRRFHFSVNKYISVIFYLRYISCGGFSILQLLLLHTNIILP